jgi:hypothetical protein
MHIATYEVTLKGIKVHRPFHFVNQARLEAACLAVISSILALSEARFAAPLPALPAAVGPADIFPPAGIRELGRGSADPPADLVAGGGIEVLVLVVVDGRTIVLATVSAGVEAARDFIVVSLFEGEDIGAMESLPATTVEDLLGSPDVVAVGRVERRFVCATPSVPKARGGAEGRTRPGRGAEGPGRADVGGRDDLGGAMEVGLKEVGREGRGIVRVVGGPAGLDG